ncbi:uncharacterized protein B0H64DRAFT_327699 [Chaetomium fimeti]|uniref:Uncharacterized protein n=1 Tax=Chaetomium fimeti TaxID=1854472 RepID=A0AAE0HAE1_9PEZI|nr:hypothetical protein B0H64DRAFT_327699 [Chaetomium fimeti]
MVIAFPQFSRLPQQIQDDIWKFTMVHTLPCVQPVGLYPFPPEHWLEKQGRAVGNPETVHDPEHINVIKKQGETLTFLLPRPEMGRRSVHYHTATETATACVGARQVFKEMLDDQVKNEVENLSRAAADPNTQYPWETDESQTPSIIFAMNTPRSQDEQKPVCSSLSDLAISSRAPHGTFPVPFNPMVDILWLDCPFVAGSHYDLTHKGWEPIDDENPSLALSSGLVSAGYYSSRLVEVRRLAVEFDKEQFRNMCFECYKTRVGRRRYLDWLEAFRETTSPERQLTHQVCLLCSVLETPEFAHLSDGQKQEVKGWLKYCKIRHLVVAIKEGTCTNNSLSIIYDCDSPWSNGWRYGGRLTKDNLTWYHVNRWWPREERLETFDLEAFRQAFPIVEKVYAAIRREGNGKDHPLYACLADFNGDTLAFYNNICADWWYFGDKIYSSYYPWRYDETAQGTICFARDENRRLHERGWCDEAGAVGEFWPLRPGASIPPGRQTFQGNGCIYVEVREPVNRSLEAGGVDGFWQYPDGGPWMENVFSFARHLSQRMDGHQRRLRSRLRTDATGGGLDGTSDRFIEAWTARGVDSPQNRAVHTGRVPEVKVLAIVE